MEIIRYREKAIVFAFVFLKKRQTEKTGSRKRSEKVLSKTKQGKKKTKKKMNKRKPIENQKFQISHEPMC